MRIGIDARFFGPKEKGLGIYVEKLVKELENADGNKNHQFFIFLKKERFNDFQSKSKNFHKILADFNWYGWREQLSYPFFLNKYNLDLMHFGHFNVPIFYRKKIVVTIHDLILFHYPTYKNSALNKFYYFFKLMVYRLVIDSAVKRASKIIAISKYTKKDLVKTLNVEEEKIEVIYQGCNLLEQKKPSKPETILKKYDIIKPYILYVGNVYPHKNLERLIDIFDSFRKDNLNSSLVLAGGEDYFQKRLKNLVKRKNYSRVLFPGFIEEKDLSTIYKEADFIVYPSLYEGFGFPPLEALVFNKNVACSDRTSMPEILGDAVYYFDPEKSDSILDCLKKVSEISKDKFSKEKKDKIKKIIKKFSWEKTAKETLKIYASVSKSKQ